MLATTPSPRIGILGPEETLLDSVESRLWPTGYPAALEAAGCEPIRITAPRRKQTWDDVLSGLDGLTWTGMPTAAPRSRATAARTSSTARKRLCAKDPR